MLPLQSFITILVACLAAGYAAVSNRQNAMGEVFGVAAVFIFFATIAGQFCFPVTPNTALPLTFVILTASIVVAWTHFACSEEREKEREKYRANFNIEIHQVVCAGTQPPSHTMNLAVEMTIHNSGADSATRSWSPVVEFMDGHHNYFADAALVGAGSESVVLNTAIIPRNGRQKGWLRFSATCSGLYDPRNPKSGLDEIKTITIHVSDYTGGTYEHTAWAHSSVDPMAMFRPTRRRLTT